MSRDHGEQAAKEVWQTIWSQRRRPLQTAKDIASIPGAQAKGAWTGAKWGGSIGMLAGPMGGAIGAGVGAATGASIGGTSKVFKILTNKVKKLIDQFKRLTDLSQKMAEHFKEFNATFKQMSIEWEQHHRKQKRAWAQLFAPLFKEIHKHLKEFDSSWQRMKRTIFKGLEPFIKDILKQMKKWQPMLTKLLNIIGQVVKWTLRIIWLLKECTIILIKFATGWWIVELLKNIFGKTKEIEENEDGKLPEGLSSLLSPGGKTPEGLLGGGGMQGGFEFFKSSIKDDLGDIPEETNIFDKYWDKVEEMIRNFFDPMWWWDQISPWLKKFLDPVWWWEQLKTAWDWFVNLLKDIWQITCDLFIIVWESLIKTLKMLWEGMTALLIKMWDTTLKVLESVWAGIKISFKFMIKSFFDLIGWIKSLLGSDGGQASTGGEEKESSGGGVNEGSRGTAPKPQPGDTDYDPEAPSSMLGGTSPAAIAQMIMMMMMASLPVPESTQPATGPPTEKPKPLPEPKPESEEPEPEPEPETNPLETDEPSGPEKGEMSPEETRELYGHDEDATNATTNKRQSGVTINMLDSATLTDIMGTELNILQRVMKMQSLQLALMRGQFNDERAFLYGYH